MMIDDVLQFDASHRYQRIKRLLENFTEEKIKIAFIKNNLSMINESS